MKTKTIIILIIFILLISVLITLYIINAKGVKILIRDVNTGKFIEVTKEEFDEALQEQDITKVPADIGYAYTKEQELILKPTLKELRDNLEYYLNKEITIEGLAEPNINCPSIDVCMLNTDYLTSEDKITVPSSKVVIPIATSEKYGLTLFKHWKCSGSLNKLNNYYYFDATYCECLTC